MAMIEQSIQIKCTPEKAFAFAADLTKAATWQTGITEAQVTSEGAIGVGTTYVMKAKSFGQTIETLGEVTAWDPPSTYMWKATKSPFPLAGGMKFQANGSVTLVTVFTKAEPGGFFKLAEGMLKAQMEKKLEEDLEALKKILEEG